MFFDNLEEQSVSTTELAKFADCGVLTDLENKKGEFRWPESS
jgi:hypothetical protein